MKKCFFFILPIFLLGIFLFGAMPAKAQYGLNDTVKKTGYSEAESPYSISTKAINMALSLVYIVFFILVLYAGIRWMTAQGNEEHVTKAKNILEAAIIGLVVISAAYAITTFVLGKVGANSAPDSAPEVPETPTVDMDKTCCECNDNANKTTFVTVDVNMASDAMVDACNAACEADNSTAVDVRAGDCDKK